MVSVKDFLRVAAAGDLIGTPYSVLDCQALVEKLHSLAGANIPNYRGSNHMWREMVNSRQPIEDTSQVLPGAMLFTIKHDGGEVARGYRDKEGNAAHIGVYLGNGNVIHSTTGGVQWDELSSKRWTHWGLSKHLDYDNQTGDLAQARALLARALDILGGMIDHEH